MQSRGKVAQILRGATALRKTAGLLLLLFCCPSPVQAGFDLSRIDSGTMAGSLGFLIFCLMLLSDLFTNRRRPR
jgi:hypothetical protein